MHERQVHGSDRRRATVQLTSAGRQLYRQIFPQVLAIHAELLRGLAPDEVATLARLLERLRCSAVALQPGPAGRPGH